MTFPVTPYPRFLPPLFTFEETALVCALLDSVNQHYKTEEKSNEITVIPLLEMLSLEGTLVTIDAMGW